MLLMQVIVILVFVRVYLNDGVFLIQIMTFLEIFPFLCNQISYLSVYHSRVRRSKLCS